MRVKSFLILVVAALMVSACGAPGGGSTATSITITDVWARPAGQGGPPSHDTATPTSGTTQGTGSPATSIAAGSTLAVYMTIHNSGSSTDRLKSVQTDSAELSLLHTVAAGDGGKSSMKPTDILDIPANGDVTLKPGSFHVMLTQVTRDLKPGDLIPLKLQFEQAGEIDVQAEIRTS